MKKNWQLSGEIILSPAKVDNYNSKTNVRPYTPNNAIELQYTPSSHHFTAQLFTLLVDIRHS